MKRQEKFLQQILCGLIPQPPNKPKSLQNLGHKHALFQHWFEKYCWKRIKLILFKATDFILGVIFIAWI